MRVAILAFATVMWSAPATPAQDAGRRSDANLDSSTAHWIKISASADGSFVVTNARTGENKTYSAPN